MDDTISRKAAIEAVQNRRMMLSKEKVLLINDLENLPSAEPEKTHGVCLDAISRQATIDAVRGYLVGKRCPDDGTLTCRLIENEVINKLPTIHNEHGTNMAEVGTDCISRKATIDAIDECYCGGEDSCGEPWIYQENAVEAIQMIEPILPAEPEVIRCKDCKHWIPYDWMFSEVWQSQNIDDYPEDEISCNLCDMHMKSSDFCSRAERRTE